MKNTKTILIVLGFIAVAAASYYVGMLRTEVKFYEKNMAGLNQDALIDPQENRGPVADVPGPSDADHIRGSQDATFAIIEYSDYDCPFCGTFHETAKQVVEDSNGEVLWVYRHFPLEGLHPEAYSKAIAAECVANQAGSDGFWEFSDELFAREDTSDLAAIVSDLGYDVDTFKTCYDNRESAAKVDADILSAEASGVSGTPGNFLMNLDSGETIEIFGALPYAEVQKAIDSIR